MQRLDPVVVIGKNTWYFLGINIMQESQQLIDSLRHMIRGMNSFAGAEE